MDNTLLDYTVDVLTVPATKTGSVTSSACDTNGYQGVSFYVVYGLSGDTLSSNVTWSGKLQSCSTENGTYSDVAAADIFVPPGITAANTFGDINDPAEDETVYGIGYNGSDRYVKVVDTATGSHTYGTPLSIIAVKKMSRSVVSEQKVSP